MQVNEDTLSKTAAHTAIEVEQHKRNAAIPAGQHAKVFCHTTFANHHPILQRHPPPPHAYISAQQTPFHCRLPQSSHPPHNPPNATSSPACAPPPSTPHAVPAPTHHFLHIIRTATHSCILHAPLTPTCTPPPSMSHTCIHLSTTTFILATTQLLTSHPCHRPTSSSGFSANSNAPFMRRQ